MSALTTEAHIAMTIVGVRVVERALPAANFPLISDQHENHYIRNAARCLLRSWLNVTFATNYLLMRAFKDFALRHGRPDHSARHGEATHLCP